MNKTDILITIGIAAYNCQRFIGEALESALQQSHQNLEILIYNDASTDNTQSILNSYNDPRIRVIQGLHNQGVAHARQTIKQQAKGEYLTWLDSDDVYYPKRVENLLNAALIYNADLVIDDMDLMSENGKKLIGKKTIPEKTKQDVFFTRLFERNTMLPHPLLHKRCYKAIDYDTSLKTSEDYDYWLKCTIAAYKFYHLKQNLIKYRVLPGSLSSNITSSNLYNKKILKKHKISDIAALYSTRGFSVETINYMTCIQYIFRENYKTALSYALKPWPAEQENIDQNFYLGTLHLVQGNIIQAKEYLEKHLNSFSNSPAGLNNMGIVQERLHQKGSDFWYKALTIFGNYADTISNLNGSEAITMTQLPLNKQR